MQKIKSSLPNMVGVLVGFSLLIGVILASVNQITEEPIKIKQEQTLAAGIKTVMQCQQINVAAPLEVTDTIDGKLSSFVIHACAGTTGERLGAAVESSTNAFGGELKVLVGFDTNGRDWEQRLINGFKKTERGTSLVKTQKEARLLSVKMVVT